MTAPDLKLAKFKLIVENFKGLPAERIGDYAIASALICDPMARLSMEYDETTQTATFQFEESTLDAYVDRDPAVDLLMLKDLASKYDDLEQDELSELLAEAITGASDAYPAVKAALDKLSVQQLSFMLTAFDLAV